MKGSLQNRILERDTEIIPEIGMGATELCYTDRYPYTVVEIIAGNKIKVQADSYEPADLNMMSNNWEYSPNPKGKIETLIKTRKGWKRLGGCTYFKLGVREYYYDYSF